MPTIDISPKILRCCLKDENRPALQQPWLEGSSLLATNGQIAVRKRFELRCEEDPTELSKLNDDVERVCIHADALRHYKGTKKHRMCLTSDGGVIMVKDDGEGTVLTCTNPSLKTPDVKGLIQRAIDSTQATERPPDIVLNPKLLSDLSDSLVGSFEGDFSGVAIWLDQTDPRGRAMLVVSTNPDDAESVGIIMPIRMLEEIRAVGFE